jgi:hypothetical protein
MSRKQPCGCEIDSAMSGTVCLDHNIIYCPTHAAAPEMLEALRPLAALASFYRDVDGEGPCFVQFNKGTVKLTGADVHRAARILAKAEGRNGQ